MGTMKKMGSSHTVPPPEARHSASTASTSIAVEATPNHQRTGVRTTITSQTTAKAA